jgi:hypothetical protein
MALPIFTKERLLLILIESRRFSKYGGKIGVQSFLSQFDSFGISPIPSISRNSEFLIG